MTAGKRDRAPPTVRRKAACRLNAHRSFFMTDGITAFVTDTELNSHDSINSRLTPIYGPHFLPAGFTLIYASSDTGQEVLNRLIRFCDRQATNYLNYLEQGTVKESEFHALSEDTSVKYRYMFRSDLEIVNPVVSGTSIADGTKISLYARQSKTDHRGPE